MLAVYMLKFAVDEVAERPRTSSTAALAANEQPKSLSLVLACSKPRVHFHREKRFKRHFRLTIMHARCSESIRPHMCGETCCTVSAASAALSWWLSTSDRVAKGERMEVRDVGEVDVVGNGSGLPDCRFSIAKKVQIG
jgi:hypothetical protein